MSTTTTNMALTKPATTDTVDIAVINTNMGIIDLHRHTGTTDGLTIQTAGLADDAVTAAKIADDVVTTAHLGTMVPALLGRQGGSATNWDTMGTTNYTSGINARWQCGMANSNTSVTITFPVAFSDVPMMLVCAYGSTITVMTPSATTVAITTAGAATVAWLAIGPE